MNRKIVEQCILNQAMYSDRAYVVALANILSPEQFTLLIHQRVAHEIWSRVGDGRLYDPGSLAVTFEEPAMFLAFADLLNARIYGTPEMMLAQAKELREELRKQSVAVKVDEWQKKGGTIESLKKTIEKDLVETASLDQWSPSEGALMQLGKSIERQFEGQDYLGIFQHHLNRLSGGLTVGDVLVIAGAEGQGKTWLAISLFRQALAMGIHAEMLPLEQNAAWFLRRVLAHHRNDWHITSRKKEDACAAAQAVNELQKELMIYAQRVIENPRMPRQGSDGRMLPGTPVTPAAIKGWISAAAHRGAKIVMLDPLAQIDFNGRDEWRDQQKFVQDITAMAEELKIAIILVVHTSKDGKNVQGAAAITRLAPLVVLVHGHGDGHVSTVTEDGHGERMVQHRMTVELRKCRNGPGMGAMLAYGWDSGPQLKELGLIAPSIPKKGEKS